LLQNKFYEKYVEEEAHRMIHAPHEHGQKRLVGTKQFPFWHQRFVLAFDEFLFRFF
jgi:hypothetical protein